MSNYEMKEGSFVLFKNKDKKGENHPDYKGKIKVNGEEKSFAAWLKTSKAGETYMSGQWSDYVNKSQEAKGHIAPSKPQYQESDNFDQDIPF